MASVNAVQQEELITVPRVQIMDEHIIGTCNRCNGKDKACIWCGGRGIVDYDVEEFVRSENKPEKALVIDRKRLEQIAEVMNYRAQTTRDMSAIVVGHTMPLLSEEKQPKVVGYADNFQVVYNRTVDGYGDVYALACDFHIYKRDEEVLLRYPRKSVELDLTKNIVDPIALLGASVPARKVGWVWMNQDNQLVKVRYSMNQEVDYAAQIASLQDDVSKLRESVEAIQKSLTKYDEFCKKYEDDIANLAQKYEEGASMSQPGPGNTYVPTAEEYEKLKQQYEELALKYRKLERISALREMKERNRIDMDENEEWEFVKDMSDEQFKLHLERIKRRYRKLDVATVTIPVAAISEQTADVTDEPDQDVKFQDEVIKYALRKNMSYQEARAELLRQRKGSLNSTAS